MEPGSADQDGSIEPPSQASAIIASAAMVVV